MFINTGIGFGSAFHVTLSGGQLALGSAAVLGSLVTIVARPGGSLLINSAVHVRVPPVDLHHVSNEHYQNVRLSCTSVARGTHIYVWGNLAGKPSSPPFLSFRLSRLSAACPQVKRKFGK